MVDHEVPLAEQFRNLSRQARRKIGEFSQRADRNEGFASVNEFITNVQSLFSDLIETHQIAIETADVNDDVIADRLRKTAENQIRRLLDASGFAPNVVEDLKKYLRLRLLVPRQANVARSEFQMWVADEAQEELRGLASLYPELQADYDRVQRERAAHRARFIASDENAEQAMERLTALRNSDFISVLRSINLDVFEEDDQRRYQAFFSSNGVVGLAAAQLSNYEHSPERALSDEQVAQLQTILSEIEIKYGYYGRQAEVVAEMKKMEYLLQQMLHENRVITLGARTDAEARRIRQQFLRPSRREIPPEIMGQIEMFLGNFVNEIDKAEIVGMIVAEAAKNNQDLSHVLNEDQRRSLEDLRNKIADYVEDQAFLMRQGIDLIGGEAGNEVRLFINEILKYVTWLNNLIEATQPREVEAAEGLTQQSFDQILASKPDQDDAASYNKYFERMFEASPRLFVERYLEGKIFPELESADETYYSTEKFTNTPGARRYVLLREFLSEMINSHDPETKRKVQEVGLENKYHFLKIRLEYIDLMGPYGDSRAGSAAFTEIIKLFPDFSLEEMAYLSNKEPINSSDLRPSPEAKDNWELAVWVNAATERINSLMNEPVELVDPNAPVPSLDNDRGPAVVEVSVSAEKDGERINYNGKMGEFSYDSSGWMGNEGSFQKRMRDRMLAELLNNEGPQWADPTLPLWRLKQIWRIAYVNFMFVRGRQTRFVEMYAAGASPPGFHELKETLREFPLAQELNLAKEPTMEIQSVVLGLKIDRFWLMRLALKRGILMYIRRAHVTTQLKGERVTSDRRHLDIDPREELLSMTLEDIDRLQEQDIHGGNNENEQRVEALLWQIANDDTLRVMDSNFARFRSILRSIFVSEAKAEWLNIKHTHHMEFQDSDGTPKHHGQGGYYLKPLVVTPYEMVMGNKALYFAGQDTQFKAHFEKVDGQLNELHEKALHTPPPELGEDTKEHAANIEKLWKDLAAILKVTSQFKSEAHLVDWHEVGVLYEWRMRILFSAYRKTHGDDPARKYGQDTGDRLGIKDESVESMVDYFLIELGKSGQMTDRMQVVEDVEVVIDQNGNERGVTKKVEAFNFEHPYGKKNERGQIVRLSLRDYLIALIDIYDDGGAYQTQIYERILNGTRREKDPVSSPAWGRYSKLSKRWNVSRGNKLNDHLMTGSGHAEAKAKEEKEVEAKAETVKH